MTPYDSNVELEVLAKIREVHSMLVINPLAPNQSVFVPNFPAANVSALNQALMHLNHVALYTTADPLFGGIGVRVFRLPVLQHYQAASVYEPKRIVGDWSATRKPADVWDARISKWFGVDDYISDIIFCWDNKHKMVQMLDAAEMDSAGLEIEEDEAYYRISPISAFAFMTEAGEHYRNGKSKPPRISDTPADKLNVWVGFNQVVWNYNVTEDVVKEFASQANADSEIHSKGSKCEIEDAPLIAWLAFNAAKKRVKSEADVDDNGDDDLGDI